MWHPQGIYARYLQSQPAIFMGTEGLYGLSDFPLNTVAVIAGKGLGQEKAEVLKKVFKKHHLVFVEKSWNGEPALDGLKGTMAELERIRPDTILAIGGGSVIDGAKLCRAFLECPYLADEGMQGARLSLTTKFLVVPTTVGSGAEASSAAVYFDREENCKKVLVDDALRPDVVVLDPDFVKDSPEDLLAASVADAFSHAWEGYVSTLANPLADILAETAIKILYAECSKADRDSVDYQRLQYAGYLSGIVQNQCLVGIAHALAHQMTGIGISHGKALAFLMPYTIQQHRQEDGVKERIDVLAERSLHKDATAFAEFAENLFARALSNPDKEKIAAFLGEKQNDADFIEHVLKDPGGKGNPIRMDESYVRTFIGEILK